jgi:hypothetical protein
MNENTKLEADRILLKYPNRVPIIILTTLKLGRKKFLVNENTTLACFMFLLRQNHLKMTSNQTLYLLFNNTIVSNSRKLGEIYREYKSADNFLYANVVIENTFGCLFFTI